mmetsp:Transcript_72905/g.161989  ORF Transcript_72905/g.161989 Transcript_72905/m.161989 type:complete len:155 (-) Transcript_72905:260-724(-)
MLDMANHGSRCGHLEFDEEEARLVVDLPVQAGGEVLLDYGARPSDEFLLQYGFAPERNPHDGATLRLPCGTRYSFGWEDSGIRTSSVVRAACEQSLAAMPTSLADDVEAFAMQCGNNTTLACALRYRIGKKQLLSAIAGHAAASAETSAFATPE